MTLPKHFLERLERLTGSDLDRAMRLFHHRDELRRVITVAIHAAVPPLPDDADVRVAVPLRDDPDAPRVVVTRAGDFVTCLGEGMRADNLYAVPYARFEAALRARASLDPKVKNDLEIQRRFTYRTLFRSMHTLGPYLSREHVESLLSRGELVGMLFTSRLAKARKHVERFARALHARRWVSRGQYLAFWRARWAYYLQLVTCAEVGAEGAREHAWEALITGEDDVACFAAVALGRIDPGLPALLRGWIRSESHPLHLRARMMLAVACAGLSHPGRRDQARAVLQSVGYGCDAPALAGFARALLDGMEQCVVLSRGRRRVDTGAPDARLFSEAAGEMGVALVLAYRGLRGWALPLRRALVDYQASRKAIVARGWVRVRRGIPRVRAERWTARNEACDCGSGRKFKKCCAGSAGGGRLAA